MKYRLRRYDPICENVFGTARRPRQTRNIKIFFPLKIARANAAAILNRFKMWYTVL